MGNNLLKHSSVEVLGCSGSIGIPNEGTTSFLVDQDILIDAGTGVCNLSIHRLERISHVVVTHMHLDHICAIPFIVDTVGVGRAEPLRVYGLPETISALKQHIFNNKIWPDFTRIPNAEKPVLAYVEVNPGDVLEFGHRKLALTAMDHTVPGLAVTVHGEHGGLVFSGDTVDATSLVQAINSDLSIKYFLVETAFPNKEKWLAELSKHLCPSMLFEQLQGLRDGVEVWVSHLKPKDSQLIIDELHAGPLALNTLKAGITFSI